MTAHLQEINEVLAHYEETVRPRAVGRIDVGLALFGIILDEARDACRFLSPEATDSAEAPPSCIRGWPIVPDHNRKPMEWAIVPA